MTMRERERADETRVGETGREWWQQRWREKIAWGPEG